MTDEAGQSWRTRRSEVSKRSCQLNRLARGTNHENRPVVGGTIQVSDSRVPVGLSEVFNPKDKPILERRFTERKHMN